MFQMNKSVGEYARNFKVGAAEKLLIGATALGGMAAANATVDITSITSSLADIAIVGGAVFSVYVGVKLFKWARAAL